MPIYGALDDRKLAKYIVGLAAENWYTGIHRVFCVGADTDERRQAPQKYVLLWFF